MATWIAHLRVAENLLNKGLEVYKEEFAAGCIAPDAGVPNEDWSSFNPPGNIAHWKDSEGKVDAEAFYNRYVKK